MISVSVNLFPTYSIAFIVSMIFVFVSSSKTISFFSVSSDSLFMYLSRYFDMLSSATWYSLAVLSIPEILTTSRLDCFFVSSTIRFHIFAFDFMFFRYHMSSNGTLFCFLLIYQVFYFLNDSLLVFISSLSFQNTGGFRMQADSSTYQRKDRNLYTSTPISVRAAIPTMIVPRSPPRIDVVEASVFVARVFTTPVIKKKGYGPPKQQTPVYCIRFFVLVQHFLVDNFIFHCLISCIKNA